MLSVDSTHDLKIAIQMMISCAQMIQLEAEEKDTKLREYAHLLVENGREAVDYLQQALDAGCSAYFMLDAAQADAVKTIRNAAEKFVPQAKRMGIRMMFHSSDSEIHFLFDEEKLSRIALNLVANALKYAQSRIAVRALKKGEEFLLEVRDDGAGFEKEAAASAYRAEGNGIGLVEVRHFALLHGGRLEIAREGGETVLRISIPMA